jgi:hypothetical protein
MASIIDGAGTIALANGSTSLVGTGTSFLAFLTAGDVIIIDDLTDNPRQIVVASVESDTAATARGNWAGTSFSGKPYCVHRVVGSLSYEQTLGVRVITAIRQALASVYEVASASKIIKLLRTTTADQALLAFGTGGTQYFRQSLTQDSTQDLVIERWTGSVWSEAFRVARATGAITFAAGSAQIRERLTGARTYYVRTDGNDVNTGLANTSGGAFATIQRALDVASQLDTAGHAVTIQLGVAGTYAGGALYSPIYGGGTVTINGSPASPASYVTNTRISSVNSSLSVSGLKISTSADFGLFADYGGSITVAGACEFGANYCCIVSYYGSRVYLNADVTISGSSDLFVYAIGGKIIVSTSRTVTLSGTPAFATAFAFADRQGHIILYPVTYSGSATGKRYIAEQSGLITTYGGTLPGSIAGTTATGGQHV